MTIDTTIELHDINLYTHIQKFPTWNISKQERRENIVVVVRTRNEARNIERFCHSYHDADSIIVADGGSEDDTVERALEFPNVDVIKYDKRVELANGYWRNNDSDHANFLFWYAQCMLPKPDWIIYDDCDCVPNENLRLSYREILRNCNDDFVMAVRLYLFGDGGMHFPYMAKPGDGHVNWETSLYAFRGNLDFKTVDVPPAYTFKFGDMDIKDFRTDTYCLELFPPLCLLHYSWENIDALDKKLKTYRESGFIPMSHPLDFAGVLEPLPEWAHT